MPPIEMQVAGVAGCPSKALVASAEYDEEYRARSSLVTSGARRLRVGRTDCAAFEVGAAQHVGPRSRGLQLASLTASLKSAGLLTRRSGFDSRRAHFFGDLGS
jgi:hypothetical protein